MTKYEYILVKITLSLRSFSGSLNIIVKITRLIGMFTVTSNLNYVSARLPTMTNNTIFADRFFWQVNNIKPAVSIRYGSFAPYDPLNRCG